MGINGLLKSLSPLLIPTNELNQNQNQPQQNNKNTNPKPKHNIRQFAHKSIAIDASSWLFKASYSCAETLAESIESNTINPIAEKRLCNYMMKRCEELFAYASISSIYLVFDGKRCPLKEVTNVEREKRRRENLMEARRLKRLGKHDLAGDKYRSCIKVMDWMGYSVAKAVKRKWGDGGNANAKYRNYFQKDHSRVSNAPKAPKVSCVFSPYEADSQLIKLCMDGVTDAIVTEDSDVLVYSAACNASIPVIYKLNRDDGSCDVITMDWLLSPDGNITDESSSSSRMNTSSSRVHNLYPSLKRILIPSNHNSNNSTKSFKKIRRQTTKKTQKQMSGPGSALLSHLNAFVARERRQKGSGARMFVQACVLTGCDYAPSQLAGVGLVTAFKMVKESAHRDVGLRFHHILNSFPRDKIMMLSGDDDTMSMSLPSSSSSSSQQKIKKEDVPNVIQTYEDILAKSEAVFYYHHVRNATSGKVGPLLQPLLEGYKIESTKNGEMNCFYPSSARFGGDLSFTGRTDACTSLPTSTTSKSTLSLSSQSKTSKNIKSTLNRPISIANNPYSVKKEKPLGPSKTISRNTSPNISKLEDGDIKSISIYSNDILKQKVLRNNPPPKNKLPKTNLLSKYAFQKNSIDTHCQPLYKKKLKRSSFAMASHGNRLSDSDSDDVLDESNVNFYSKGRTNSYNTRYPLLASTITSTNNTPIVSLTPSSQSTTTSGGGIKRSKYFSDQSYESDDRMEDIENEISFTMPSSVTSKMTTTKTRNSSTHASSIYSKKQETSHVCDIGDSDVDGEESNDCMIIDDPSLDKSNDLTSKSSSFLEKNSRFSIFEKFQRHTSAQPTDICPNTNNNRNNNSNSTLGGYQNTTSFSSFNKAQSGGTRAKFSPSSTTKPPSRSQSIKTPKVTRKRNFPTVTPSTKKRGKTTSIKNFFSPLSTRRQS